MNTTGEMFLDSLYYTGVTVEIFDNPIILFQSYNGISFHFGVMVEISPTEQRYVVKSKSHASTFTHRTLWLEICKLLIVIYFWQASDRFSFRLSLFYS
jgi:hypothetical protein